MEVGSSVVLLGWGKLLQTSFPVTAVDDSVAGQEWKCSAATKNQTHEAA